jgi:hypothetical protein
MNGMICFEPPRRAPFKELEELNDDSVGHLDASRRSAIDAMRGDERDESNGEEHDDI